MMRQTSKEACAVATQAIVDQAEGRYRCLCDFATKDHRRMDHHRITCEVWLADGQRQWNEISGAR